MKKENILVFLKSDTFYFYNINKNKEIIEEVDTTSFFDRGEIKSVDKFKNFVKEFIDKYNIGSVLRPNLIVLYNDVCSSDIECLYKMALSDFNYSDIKFIKLGNLITSLDNHERIIYFDKDVYTSFKLKIKGLTLDFIQFEPIIIGKNDNNYIHYSDKNMMWNLFKSHFTK